MNRYHGIFLMAVMMPMVFGVPLLSRVKRQIPEEDTNELPDNYPENPGDQNPDGQIVDQTTNDVPNESPKQQQDASMVGADDSPYRKNNIAPGYGDQQQPVATGQEPNAAQEVPPQENMALPLEDASRSGQTVPVIPAPGQPLNDAHGQYISREPVVEGGEPGTQQETNEVPDNYPENPGDQNRDGQIANQISGVPNESPKQQSGVPMVGADNSPYRKYNMAPGYGDQEQPVVTGQEPNSAQDVPPPGTPHGAPSQTANIGAVPAVPSSGEPVQPQDQNVDINSPYRQYEPPQVPESGGLPPLSEGPVPPGYGVSQNQYEGNNNSPYVPQVPTQFVGDVNPQYIPNAAQQMPGSGKPLPVQPQEDSEFPQNQYIPYAPSRVPVSGGNLPVQPQPDSEYPQNQYIPYAPSRVPVSGEPLPVQPQPDSEFPQNQYIPYAPSRVPVPGENLPVQPQPDSEYPQNQYIPYAPSRVPVSGEPLPVQPQPDSEFPQNQYIPYAPSRVPVTGENLPVQPQAESGLPQNQNPGDLNQQYYNPIAPSQNAGYVNPELQPQVATDSPIVNSTNRKTTTDYETETPDYWGWFENNGDDDRYPNPDSDANDYSIDLFGNVNNNQPTNIDRPTWDFESSEGEEPTDSDMWDFESSEDEEPFNPYDSLDDVSYQNLLEQEKEDFKPFEEYGDGEKPFSPGDRLQPGIYTNWQLDHSQPPSTAVNPQAANGFLLYCIPAILLTLIIYVAYTNWIRKPKIVRIPSGNNWRADYRDIEAKSKEIEPMLRKAEMY